MNFSIRIKVLAILCSFILIYGVIAIFNVHFNKKKDLVRQFDNDVKTLQVLMLKDATTVSDFFAIEPHSSLFRKTGNSYYVEEHKVYISSTQNVLGKLMQSAVLEDFGFAQALKRIQNSIHQYSKQFQELVALTRTGNKPELNNKKENLDMLKNQLLSELSLLDDKTEIRTIQLNQELSFVFQFGMLLFLILVSVISLILSRQITKRVIALSDVISNFVASKFTDKSEPDIKYYNDEIGALTDNFIILREEVWQQIHFFEEKLAQRTARIESQNLMIREQNEEILCQRDEVIEKNHIIEKQNRNFIESINYAKTIQEAFLPNMDTIYKVFPESFVLWKPKATVSGDFYWFKNIRKENLSILAMVDCTGHGVPGAFMSMLGNSLLNEIILRKKNYNAAKILNLLRSRVVETLNIEGNTKQANDGMDVALLVIDHSKNTLQFAGADRPMYLIRNHQLHTIAGDKMPVGLSYKENRSFTNKELYIENNDTVYIFSDGFPDQFGGENNRKFTSRRLKNTLLEHHSQDMTSQGALLTSLFEDWKEGNEQTDDVLLIGIRPQLGLVPLQKKPGYSRLLVPALH